MAHISHRHVNSESPLSGLTDQQKRFAMFIAEGKPAATACRLAGYSAIKGNVQRLVRHERIVKAVHHLQKRYEKSIVASRQQVLEGFLEAIQQAKVMSDPAVQIAGWREIGKMCGYYAPEVKEVNVTIGAKRLIGQLEVMSDAALLELIEKEQSAIEGVAHEILETEEVERDPNAPVEPLIPDEQVQNEL